VDIGWRDVWVGAAVTALLFTIGKLLVGLYVAKSSVASSFGAAGSLAVLLIWVYYSAQIFLLGAEFTWVFAHRYGSRKGRDKPATAKESVATAGERKPERSPPDTGGRMIPQRPMAETFARAARPHERGVTGVALRHMAAATSAAIVLGALAGRVARRRH
jgi:hypothetical protein